MRLSYVDIKDVQSPQGELNWSVAPRTEPYGSALSVILDQITEQLDLKVCRSYMPSVI